MSQFLTRMCLENANDTDDGQYIVMAPLVYESDVAKQTFTVPVGFKTDLASVPRMPIIFMLTGDTSSQAACLHDYLYTTHPVDRKTADAVLREASAVTEVPWWRRQLMWLGVRIGGGSHW